METVHSTRLPFSTLPNTRGFDREIPREKRKELTAIIGHNLACFSVQSSVKLLDLHTFYGHFFKANHSFGVQTLFSNLKKWTFWQSMSTPKTPEVDTFYLNKKLQAQALDSSPNGLKIGSNSLEPIRNR